MNKQACYSLAHRIAKAAGFSNFSMLHRAVITKGALASAGGDVAKAHALTLSWYVAQTCVWAAEAKGEARATWLREAAAHAFKAWLDGRATLQAVAS